ncbi:hypothetical protein SDC9_171338 [bioreactor metagenome]|uniref:Uncharacterized protein n=1 Tax=bioreactor metagenome TaxID=1076179 RepID=A0A645GBD2_9ZZZZ
MSPWRAPAFTRMPNALSSPKRLPISTLKPHSDSDAKPRFSAVFGASPARLAIRLTAPPTAPLGDMPLSSTDGPLSTSARSMNSGETRNWPRMPGKPLSAISSLETGNPRIIIASPLVPSPYSSRTAGSSWLSVAVTLRVCVLVMVSAV